MILEIPNKLFSFLKKGIDKNTLIGRRLTEKLNLSASKRSRICIVGYGKDSLFVEFPYYYIY